MGRGSRVKILCSYKHCTALRTDCKNKPHTAAIDDIDVDVAKTRALHPQARLVRFCSQAHRDKCLAKKSNKRGGREALSALQVAHLFKVMAARSCWAAVMQIVSIMTGERAETVSRVRDSWFRGLDPDGGELPSLQVPSVNKKTRQHDVPLNKDFARLLWSWYSRPQGSEMQQLKAFGYEFSA